MATGPSLAEPQLAVYPERAQASGRYHIPLTAVCAALLSVAGVYSIWSTALYLLDLWRTDPLKSVGALVPFVSCMLILRAWRALGWRTDGSWWGMAVLVPAIALVHWRDHALLELVLSPSWTIFLPPHSLVAFAYVSGVVLLFGGTRLYRAAVFPTALMLLVNPVPHFFNRFVDLPLQHLSATTARAFAQALGQRLTPDELYLMFTPSLGMFIAPGCNGIRGSVTMGLIALIAAYLYRFRLSVAGAVLAGAVLLGYVFNLVRLCVLVLYYIVALHLPWLGRHAEMGDYLIGAALFFCAAVLLFTAIGHFSPTGDLRPPPLRFAGAPQRWNSDPNPENRFGRRAFWMRWFAFALLAAAGSVSYARRSPGGTLREEALFPRELGRYTLRRTWGEKLAGGTTLFEWAEYGVPASPATVQVGISPVLGAHDTLLCHTARGETWLWHRQSTLGTANGPVSFSTSFFGASDPADGAGYLEAATVCSGERCGQWSHAGRSFGLVYSRTDAAALLKGSPQRPIPVLIKVGPAGGETSQGVTFTQTALQTRLADFLAGTSIVGLTRPYRVR